MGVTVRGKGYLMLWRRCNSYPQFHYLTLVLCLAVFESIKVSATSRSTLAPANATETLGDLISSVASSGTSTTSSGLPSTLTTNESTVPPTKMTFSSSTVAITPNSIPSIILVNISKSSNIILSLSTVNAAVTSTPIPSVPLENTSLVSNSCAISSSSLANIVIPSIHNLTSHQPNVSSRISSSMPAGILSNAFQSTPAPGGILATPTATGSENTKTISVLSQNSPQQTSESIQPSLSLSHLSHQELSTPYNLMVSNGEHNSTIANAQQISSLQITQSNIIQSTPAPGGIFATPTATGSENTKTISVLFQNSPQQTSDPIQPSLSLSHLSHQSTVNVAVTSTPISSVPSENTSLVSNSSAISSSSLANIVIPPIHNLTSHQPNVSSRISSSMPAGILSNAFQSTPAPGGILSTPTATGSENTKTISVLSQNRPQQTSDPIQPSLSLSHLIHQALSTPYSLVSNGESNSTTANAQHISSIKITQSNAIQSILASNSILATPTATGSENTKTISVLSQNSPQQTSDPIQPSLSLSDLSHQSLSTPLLSVSNGEHSSTIANAQQISSLQITQSLHVSPTPIQKYRQETTTSQGPLPLLRTLTSILSENQASITTTFAFRASTLEPSYQEPGITANSAETALLISTNINLPQITSQMLISEDTVATAQPVSILTSTLDGSGCTQFINETLSSKNDSQTSSISVLISWPSNTLKTYDVETSRDTLIYSSLSSDQPSFLQSSISLSPSFDSLKSTIQTSEIETATQFSSAVYSSIYQTQKYTTTTATQTKKTTFPIKRENVTMSFNFRGKCAIRKINESNLHIMQDIFNQIANETNGLKTFLISFDFQPCNPFNKTFHSHVEIVNNTIQVMNYIVNATIVQDSHRPILFIVNVQKQKSHKPNGSALNPVIIILASCVCGVMFILFMGFFVRESCWKNRPFGWKWNLTRIIGRRLRPRSISLTLTGMPRSASLYSEMKDNGSVASQLTPRFGIYSTLENETQTSFMRKSDLRRSSGRSGKHRRSLTKNKQPDMNGQAGIGQSVYGAQTGRNQGKNPYGLVIGVMGVKRSHLIDDTYAVPQKSRKNKERKVYGLAVRPTSTIPKPSPSHSDRENDNALPIDQSSGVVNGLRRHHKHYMKHGGKATTSSHEKLTPHDRQSERGVEGIENPAFDKNDSQYGFLI